MSTVKFSLQDELNKLQAEIYLLTGKKFTTQQLLEVIFSLGHHNIEGIVDKLVNPDIETSDIEDPLDSWLATPVDGDEDTDSVKEHDLIQ